MFRDRTAAGRQLAERLRAADRDSPVVLGLARGGMPVAAEVARGLGAPLDVLVVRKIGCPWHRELALGAISEQGPALLNHELIAEMQVGSQALREVIDEERRELDRRLAIYRGIRRPVDVRGRSVILVDDGIATGATAEAAIRLVRQRGADRIILAVPVAPTRAIRRLQSVADEVVCLHSSDDFYAVGQFYVDFRSTSDDEVAAILNDLADRPAT